MRVYLLWFVTFILCCYSTRDWFKPIPFLIFMMPLYGNPDFPSGAWGIQGLNPWNILLLVTVLNYLLQKNQDCATWDMDNSTTILLFLYILIISISAIRAIFDLDTLHSYGNLLTGGQIISENLINCVKFLVPAFLIYTGARTERRRKLVLLAIITSHLYIAFVVIKGIPMNAVTDERALTLLGLKILQKTFSWSKVNTAMLLAGGAWLMMFAVPYLVGKRFNMNSIFSIGLFVLTSFALALTGGRMGYGVWGMLGFFFSIWRWKKGFIFVPIVLAIIVSAVPSVRNRLLSGISSENNSIMIDDAYQVTSGRTDVWPIVLERIGQSPWVGYGAMAMTRTGATAEADEMLNVEEGERGFPHPHNAYLWLLLDTGILGAIPVLFFWIVVLQRSIRLCGEAGTESDAIGVTSLTTSLALLLGGLGSQNFYPVHGAIAMWAAIALAFRLYADKYQGSSKIPNFRIAG